ncbi:RNA methyltransferase [Brevundimonas sp.]|uniref:TrmH family RNA methyltransferase n=1 Tax=Brevundimonas sp. TaxID=1871086 RepID=UPI0028A26CC4|nr:RNA methyltransferase [Brevundimonas sp.]
MNLIPVSDIEDLRVSAFRDVKERDLTGRQGLFVAEGEVVLRVLASPASRCAPVAVLIAEKRLEALGEILERLPDDVPIHTAPQDVLDGVAGFHLHRGILALGRKPEALDLEGFLDSLPDRAVVVGACGVGNHDNMGGLFRNAAAFGAAGLLLDTNCCDPFYRKAIRVSVGAVLRTPFVEGPKASDMVAALQARGFEVLALTPSAAEALSELKPAPRTAILLGSEGPGLPADVIGRCRPLGIRMSGGFDSLNVAATSAVALHHLTTSEGA